MVPPLLEQQRIAARLREQLAEVAKAREAVQAQVETARKLPTFILRSMFSGPAAKRWPRRRLGEVCEITAQQVNPTVPEYRGLPHVSAENIVGGMCRLLEVRSAAEDGMESGKYLFERGEVLYSKLRPYLRKAVVAPFRGLCSADMYPIRVNPAVFSPQFFAWLLLGEEFTAYANEASQRSRMPKLNREQLFSWALPTPPLDEQDRLSAIIDLAFEGIRKVAGSLGTHLAAIDHLPAAILRDAFN
jgi:type I restriction enzyme S subunit